MVTQASVVQELESIAGREHTGPGEGFAVDAFPPRAVVRPGSYEQVAEVLRYADRERLAVIPWGAGTHMALGNVPARYDIALSLARLDRVVEHEPADLTLTCQAGMPLGPLRQHMARAGQAVPLDPTIAGQATVGGALAANACGPYRMSYGSARDFTIGMRVVTADGRITRAGGKVVKNVAGYDLCKLYIGSLGTLGVIVEATFKVRPLPREERGLAFAFPAVAQACAVAGEAERRGLSVAAAQLANGDTAVLSLVLAGMPAAIERSAREIAALAGERGGAEASSRHAGLGQKDADTEDPGGVVVRLGVLPAQVPAIVSSLEQGAPGVRMVAYPTVGLLRAHLEGSSALKRVRQAAQTAGAWLVVESCPTELKREIDVFGEPPPAFGLMRCVKQQFDPNGVLSPGRFLGRL